MVVLNPKQTEDLSNSWILVESKIQDNGLRLFVNLFSQNPDIQTKFFPHFSINDLVKLRKHGTGVMRDIELMVNCVKNGDDESLVGKINKVTQHHYTRGIQHISSYEALSEIIILTLEESLGPEMTPDVRQAWTAFLQIMIQVVASELQRIEKANKG